MINQNPQNEYSKEIEAFVKSNGSKASAARLLGIPRRTLSDRLEKAGVNQLSDVVGGKITAVEADKIPLPPKGKFNAFICTVAQSSTQLHSSFFTLEQIMNDIADQKNCNQASLLVSQITYNKGSYGKKSVKPGTKKESDDDSLWFAPETIKYATNERVQLAPDLIFCGEDNALPTAKNPLTALEAYAGHPSLIIPHNRLQMKPAPRPYGMPPKNMFSTGTVTQRNFIQKRAGIEAEFHHAYGGLIVLIDSDGFWFPFELTADNYGKIYFLNKQYGPDGIVKENVRPEALIPGDIHADEIDPGVWQATWSGERSVIDTLQPRKQVWHDLLSMRRRSKHDIKDKYLMYIKYVANEDKVEDEIEVTAKFTREASRPFCQSFVCHSNHDEHLEQWMKITGAQDHDYPNVRYYHELEAEKYRQLENSNFGFNLMEWALLQKGMPKKVQFLSDEPVVICKKYGGGILISEHGHSGINGGRASPVSMRKVSVKTSVGHSHSPHRIDGFMQGGTSSLLNLGYNKGGFTTWDHVHQLIYPNAKRCFLFIRNSKWIPDEFEL